LEATTVAIWLPMFIVFFLIMTRQVAARRIAFLTIKKKRRKLAMTNEMIAKYVGRNCYITTGTMGVSVTGKIIEVNENWIEVETRKGVEILNLDFIQNIKLK